jgi:sulfite exporter TauE/SafE
MDSLFALLFAAVPLAFVHTIVCVDHYVPFIALGKSNGWAVRKTLGITALCGMGRIVSSLLLGIIGIGLSVGASNLMGIQDFRGEFAVWFLIAFGLVYMAYGIRKAVRNSPHTHNEGLCGPAGCGNPLAAPGRRAPQSLTRKTTLGLLVLFAFIPCEPMIPIIMFPALTESGVFGVAAVTLTYTFFTIATMTAMTYIGLKGLQRFRFHRLERYAHALAGFAVFACGVAVKILHSHPHSGCSEFC